MYACRYYKRKHKKWIYVFAVIIFVALFFLCFLIFNKIKSDDTKKNAQAETLSKASNDIVAIVSDTIESEIRGCGVVVNKDGIILTNEHLARDNCVVEINDNTKVAASVLWSNAELDLAILKVNYSFENEAVIPDDISLEIGEEVYAIGNPVNRDFEKTVTKGIISGLNRNVEFEENGKMFYLNNLIQFDAVTNFGNSGGALINKSGQLIGICTIKLTSAEGMSFAVPTSFVKAILEEIKKNGKFEEPKLNLTVYDKYSVKKINNGIDMNEGIYIASVSSDSNAEKSGIRPGDIIEKFDDKEIKNMVDFRMYLYEKRKGEKAAIIVKRDNKKYSVQVILE